VFRKVCCSADSRQCPRVHRYWQAGSKVQKGVDGRRTEGMGLSCVLAAQGYDDILIAN
jgi:hypothetical protein